MMLILSQNQAKANLRDQFSSGINIYHYNWMSLQKKLRSLRTITFLSKQLSFRKVPEAEASIDILLEHSVLLSSRARLNIKSYLQKRASLPALAAYYAIRLLKIRRYHYPIQYLIGQWQFRQLALKVKPPILIPRFETEYLVGEAITAIRKRWKKGSEIKFADLGCGTGAIGLSLVKELQDEYRIHGVLLDINPACVNLARQNAIKNHINLQRVRFVCDDMRNSIKIIQECQFVISNPPYLSSNSHKKLQMQVRLYQAQSALVGGPDGLDYIKFLVTQIKRLKTVKQDLMCFIQYGGQDLSSLGIQEHVKSDQYGRPRFLIFD